MKCNLQSFAIYESHVENKIQTLLLFLPIQTIEMEYLASEKWIVVSSLKAACLH